MQPDLLRLLEDPRRAAEIAPTEIAALLAKLAAHQSIVASIQNTLAARLAGRRDQQQPILDGAVGIEEAARTLGMKPSTLYKKWRELAIGYRDVDGRVKFTRSALNTYLSRRGG